MPARPNLLGSLQSLCSSLRPRAGTGTLGDVRYGQLQSPAEHPICRPPATLPCSGTCAGARPFAPSHQAYCAGPMAVLTRFVSLSSPWGLSVSRALPLLFSSPHRQSFLSVDHCDLSYETACKRACHSFLVLLVKLSVIPFFASCFCESAATVVHCFCPSGWHCTHSFFTRFSLVSWFFLGRNVDRQSYLFDQLSLIRGLCLWKRKATNRCKNKTTKKTELTY